MTYFTSTDDFNLMAANEAKKVAKLPENVQKFERFSNEDYKNLKESDLRSVRYHRSSVYEDVENEAEEAYFEKKRARTSEGSLHHELQSNSSCTTHSPTVNKTVVNEKV